MKSLLLSCLMSFALILPAFTQGDAEGCKDHEMIPNRIPGYVIGSCESNEFSSHTVATTNGEKSIEGRKWVIDYVLGSGSAGVSETFVRKNYMEALKKQGAIIQFESNGRGVAMLKKPDGTQWWVDVAGYTGDGTPEATGRYILTIVQVAGMEQVITAKSMGDELKNTGKTVLYIQFETGKSIIRPESVPMVEQMAALLNADKTLSVFIVGHTDNTGTLESNLKLSEDRAIAVVTMLVNTYKVSASQVTAKGVGPLAPLAGNQTEDGRKLNRRVEMVKR